MLFLNTSVYLVEVMSVTIFFNQREWTAGIPVFRLSLVNAIDLIERHCYLQGNFARNHELTKRRTNVMLARIRRTGTRATELQYIVNFYPADGDGLSRLHISTERRDVSL